MLLLDESGKWSIEVQYGIFRSVFLLLFGSFEKVATTAEGVCPNGQGAFHVVPLCKHMMIFIASCHKCDKFGCLPRALRQNHQSPHTRARTFARDGREGRSSSTDEGRSMYRRWMIHSFIRINRSIGPNPFADRREYGFAQKGIYYSN